MSSIANLPQERRRRLRRTTQHKKCGAHVGIVQQREQFFRADTQPIGKAIPIVYVDLET